MWTTSPTHLYAWNLHCASASPGTFPSTSDGRRSRIKSNTGTSRVGRLLSSIRLSAADYRRRLDAFPLSRLYVVQLSTAASPSSPNSTRNPTLPKRVQETRTFVRLFSEHSIIIMSIAEITSAPNVHFDRSTRKERQGRPYGGEVLG